MATNAILPDGLEADETGLDSVPQSDDPPTYGENNRDMPQDLTDKLEGIVKLLLRRNPARLPQLVNRCLSSWYGWRIC